MFKTHGKTGRFLTFPGGFIHGFSSLFHSFLTVISVQESVETQVKPVGS